MCKQPNTLFYFKTDPTHLTLGSIWFKRSQTLYLHNYFGNVTHESSQSTVPANNVQTVFKVLKSKSLNPKDHCCTWMVQSYSPGCANMHPHLIICASMGPRKSTAVFAQFMPESSYSLQWVAPFPPQNCPFTPGSEPQFNTWFLGST